MIPICAVKTVGGVTDGSCSDEPVNASLNVDVSVVPIPDESLPTLDESDVCERTEAACSGSCVTDCVGRTLEWVSQ